MPFSNKIEAITVQMLVQALKKILVCDMESTKTYPKFVTLHSFFKIVKKKLQKRRKKFRKSIWILEE